MRTFLADTFSQNLSLLKYFAMSGLDDLDKEADQNYNALYEGACGRNNFCLILIVLHQKPLGTIMLQNNS